MAVRWTQTFEEGFEERPTVRSITPSEMGVAFQPIVHLEKRKVFAAEMLARCERPEFGNPADLFEQAELQSATGRLGRIVREAGFLTAPDLPLFINLHPHELKERWVVRPDDPMNYFENRLYLEITESAALDYYELCRSTLHELSGRLRAKLVVDDFGAGHSNLDRIAELEPAFVKLDRGLIAGVDQRPRRLSIVRHMVHLCAELGAEVIAEGVETRDELAACRDAGVQYAQGYVLARPAPIMPEVDWSQLR